VDETHVSLQRTPLIFKAAAGTTLFPVRMELVFGRNMSCKSELSKWRKVHFYPNSLLT
jgi:hypothetical protein